jgi:hypothetical protein
MFRRAILTFAFFGSFAASYAFATETTVSPEMQCIARCAGHGIDLGTCVDICCG